MEILKLPNLHAHIRVALLAACLGLLFSAVGMLQAYFENGAFCYALDDSFIMMAISRNLADFGVWGLTRYEFSSTASSPFFTLILAGFNKLMGSPVWLPLAINVIALLGLYVWAAIKAAAWNFKLWQTWFLLMGLFFLMPIPVLLFGSMEHILHTWIALVVLDAVVSHKLKANALFWLLSGILLGGIRYEGLFQGGLILLVFVKEKRWKDFLFFGFGLAAPMTVLGIYSVYKGWFFLPNSLVLKGYGMNIQNTITVLGYLYSLLMKAANHPHVLATMFALWLLGNWNKFQKKAGPDLKLQLYIVAGMQLLHFVFARFNHVYRYEAYLMACSWWILWPALVQILPIQSLMVLKNEFSANKIQAILLLVLFASPLWRSVESYAVGTRAMCNIYQQQVQTARFIKSYYDTATIGAIDVGAIAYYSDCKLLDLWGLGTMEFAQLKLKDRYTPQTIDFVCRRKNMEVAVVYGNDIRNSKWQKAESWVIPHNVVCSRDTISFFAINPDAFRQLKQNLRAFAPKLSPHVLRIEHP